MRCGEPAPAESGGSPSNPIILNINMCLFLPDNLPAIVALSEEGFDVSGRSDGELPTERLRIALLNLMPNKMETELQFSRVLAKTGFAVELILLKPASYVCKTACPGHLDAFYKTWDDVQHEPLNGLIITGAPVETLPFSEVRYWEELTSILDSSRDRNLECLFICWAAQAALHHFHQVPKHELQEKAFGVFQQQVLQFGSSYLHGMGAQFPCPVSRHTEIRWGDLMGHPDLQVLAGSQEAGLCLVEERKFGALYMFNHLEYDAETLASEYRRDLERDGSCPLPANCFRYDDPDLGPEHSWASSADAFFTNWLRVGARRRMAESFVGSAA